MDQKQKRRLLRLVNLLGLIKDKAGVRAKDLAEKCGVSIRTFFRDLKILEKAGFPVFHRRGYRIFSNFSLEPVSLTLDEALTVRAGCNHLHYYEQYIDSAESVLKKIEKILLVKSGGLLKVFESDKTQPTLFEMLQDSPDLFGSLKYGTQNTQAVKIAYLDEKNNYVEDLFWPEALIFRKKGWIFVGKNYQNKGVKEIPFEKIKKVTATNLTKGAKKAKK